MRGGALLQVQAIELLTHAWDDALTFKRASRSLAKTGFLDPLETVKNRMVFDGFRRWSLQWHFLTCKKCSVFEVSGGLRVKKCSVFEVFIKYFLGGAQRAPKIDFGGLWGPFESPLGSPFGHVGGSVEPLGDHLGPKWSQKRQHEGLKSDLGSSRGGQGVPEALQGVDFGRIFDDFWT